MILCEGFQSRTLPLSHPIEGLAAPAATVFKALAEGLKPTPPLDFVAWASENVIFGKESEFSGPYNPDLFPFFNEPLACLQPSHPAREVVLKKSAQIGGTVVAQVFTGACLDLDPGPFAYFHPSIDNAKRWARTKWGPFVRLSQPLRNAFQSDRSRDTSNTVLYKERKDNRGHLLISAANSESTLSMISTPRQVQDDLSKWESNTAGDTEAQADSRSEGFLYAKILKVGTPMIKGACRISKNYELSDQRKFLVPCPHCSHRHSLEWENFRASLFEGMEPAEAHFTCPSCGGVIEHHHKSDMVAQGSWIKHNERSRVPGFYIWAAYSPLTTWARIAEKYLKAMGNPKEEQTFYNDTLGLAYEQKGEAPPWRIIRDRSAAGYTRGTIPANALMICAGVDCQGDRVEWHVKGYGPNLQRFTIDYGVIEGHISEARTRSALDNLLKRHWKNEFGRGLGIDMLAIDANYDTQDVLDWAKKHPDNRVIAVRGTKGEHAPPLIAVKYERTKGVRVRKHQKKFFNVGVSSLKASLFRQLEKKDPQERGYCGYPQGMEDDFFIQLCSERRVMTQLKSGFVNLEWAKLPGVRNEVLDTEMYGEAAARRLGWAELSDAGWDKMRGERECPPAEQQSDMFEANMAGINKQDELKPIMPVDIPEDDNDQVAREPQPSGVSEPKKQLTSPGVSINRMP